MENKTIHFIQQQFNPWGRAFLKGTTSTIYQFVGQKALEKGRPTWFIFILSGFYYFNSITFYCHKMRASCYSDSRVFPRKCLQAHLKTVLPCSEGDRSVVLELGIIQLTCR